MTTPITVLVPIKLASGKTEDDLLAASEIFEKEFVSKQSGVIRRELVRKGEGEYIDIVQFRSSRDMEDVIEKEKNSPVCDTFFALMDMQNMDDSQMAIYPSLATYC